jgi:hypothetical protein
LKFTDFSEERIAAIFRIEEQATNKQKCGKLLSSASGGVSSTDPNRGRIIKTFFFLVKRLDF